jgi:hypothetical protein
VRCHSFSLCISAPVGAALTRTPACHVVRLFGRHVRPGHTNEATRHIVKLQTTALVCLAAPIAASCLALLAPFAGAQISPGSALRFDGTNGYVSVAHTNAFNAYPLTATAWIRTTNTAAAGQGIVSKYADGSGNGWTVFVSLGSVRAFLYRDFGNFVDLDGGFVADGRWHHVAFSVDPTGGRLFVDGVLKKYLPVTGAPTAPTTTVPLQIGRYHTYLNRFQGDIDEVSVWNQALDTNAVNYVKHRRLAGNTDGLVGLWRLDEGAGTTTSNAVAGAVGGTLISSPAWVPSTAPIALAPVATNCLRFDGVNGYVEVPHHTNLNAFPLTASAWFRTTNTGNVVQGVVSKAADGSGNSWSILVQSGKLRGFYYRTFANFAIDAVSVATVADGGWHHAAMVVDASGGKLFLDGNVVGSGTWPSTPSAPTNSEPVLIGRYYNYVQRFQGALDEIAIWNRALTTNEIRSLKNRLLAGSESNLVGYWQLNEGSGTTAADITGHGHNGTLLSSPLWVGSLARLGDGSQHLLANLDQADYGRFWALGLSPTANTFPVPATATIRRFHDFDDAPAPVTVDATLDATLADDALQPVALNGPAQASFNFVLPSENANAPATNSVRNLTGTLLLDPVQLASVNNTHAATVTLSHSEDGGGTVPDETVTLPLVKLLDFNGTLFFGTTETRFSSVANTPLPGAPSGGGIATIVLIDNNSGYLVAKPTYHFGNGGNFANVVLFDDGHAQVTSGTLAVTGPAPDREVLNGITFDRTGLTISPVNGIRATVILRYPYGFSTRTGSPTNRLTVATASFANTLLDDTLIPQAATLTVPGPLWGVEETKPFWMQTPSLDWNLASGQLVLNAPVTVRYVRQAEDDSLNAQRPNLTDPLAADRISNDGYYHNAVNATGSAVVRSDANGGALLSVDVELRETELRPHFPYTSSDTSGHIPAIGGRLLIQDDLIDGAASYLQLAGPVPVAYARDCADKSCSGLALIGPGIMALTAEANQLHFTPDGGLRANGTVPPQNLTWGYLGGSDFAQRTSDVEAGAFHMPGTFLRADQTTLEDGSRPAVILLTGVGSAADPAYAERPGQASYFDGLANYAGLNFRGPAQGHSILANRPTGWYPLIPDAKYYARFGGISGIHQASSFPSALKLYGYDFTFTRFAVSYLESENWQSRTDGAIDFPPQPAGFVQEFNNLKFLCRGGLESASIPPGLPDKHLAYWNVDFKPLTMQFRSRTNDTSCSPTDRKLVLGVETKLPFIPEAFQAALGFNPDGNLVVAADGVTGVDSRFPLPAQLSLQGPGGSHYRIATASDGYFNNWANPDRPAEGFFNIAGRMDVFFFEDVKVHLHVTPTGPASAEVAVMGGWRALDKHGKDLGWTEGTDNFFNKAKFDPTHRGFPSGVSIAGYRDSPTEVYHPRAQKDWIEVAEFDYPLLWNKGLRQFSSFEDSKVVLPIIDVSSRLKQLTPGKADLDFSQDLELKLPRIKALDFVNDALDEINGPMNSLSNAVVQALGSAIDSTGLTRGLHGLQHALRDQADDFFRPVLNGALDPVVDRMYVQFSNQLSTDAPNFLKNVSNIVASAGVDLKGGIRQINGAAGNVNSVVGQLNKILTDVDDTVGLLLRIVEKDGSGNRHAVRTLLQQIAEDQGPALGVVGSIGDEVANGLLADLEPTLAQLETDLRDIRAEFGKIRGQVAGASGDFSLALNSVSSNAGALDQYQKLTIGGLTSLFGSVVTPAGDYFTANPAEAKRAIRERLIVTFLASSMPAKYQEAFKQFLYEDDALLNTLLETLFQQVNQSIRNAISSQLAGATDGKFLGMKGPGSFSKSLAAAKIRGAPTFNGDALRKIRLDADVQLNLGDEIHFTAYMEIKELDSQSTPIECIPAGAPAAEVVIGARDVPLEWFGLSPIPPSKLTLTVEARWTLQGGSVIGIGGLFDVKGKVGLKGCSINEIGATLAIGEIENFFGAKAAGTITILGIPVDITAGIFVGHACSLDPLIFIDPEAPKVLDNAASFTGIYVQFGGSLSLSEILFGTSSCFLDMEAAVTSATYYMDGPRSGKLGMRQKTSVEVEVICLISGHVDIALSSSLSSGPNGLELILGGEADACGKIGYCPFCVEGCVGITVKGIVNDGGVDYSVDF